MTHFLRLFSVGLILLLSACDKKDMKPNDGEPGIVTMHVADRYRDCTGVGPQKCLWVKTEGESNWHFHYAGIENFAYEEGYEYTLSVKLAPVDNPPMDGSSIRYILLKIVEKTRK